MKTALEILLDAPCGRWSVGEWLDRYDAEIVAISAVQAGLTEVGGRIARPFSAQVDWALAIWQTAPLTAAIFVGTPLAETWAQELLCWPWCTRMSNGQIGVDYLAACRHMGRP